MLFETPGNRLQRAESTYDISEWMYGELYDIWKRRLESLPANTPSDQLRQHTSRLESTWVRVITELRIWARRAITVVRNRQLYAPGAAGYYASMRSYHAAKRSRLR